MSLKHVSMWHESEGWIRVTDMEADQLFAHTVHADERVFMCDLCHRHVIFVKGRHQASHFKHNKSDPDKDCADRTQALAQSEQNILRNTIANPIRIKVDGNTINLEIGFLPMPTNLLDESETLEIQICVSASYGTLLTKNINNHNFSSDEVVFHSIGNVYSDKYKMQIIPADMATHYPLLNREICGMHSQGTLFDYQSGQKIPLDGDIEVNSQYYLLTRTYIGSYRDISVNRLFSDKRFTLYIVVGEKITKETTEFFFKFHCRLTTAPTKLIPIWPVIHESEHYLETTHKQLNFVLKGNSVIKIEPSMLNGSMTAIPLENNENLQLIHIKDVSRIRMLWAASVTSVLNYLSIYHTNHTQAPISISYNAIEICTDNQQPFRITQNGMYSSLPKKNRLYITFKYDGKVTRQRNGNLYHSERVKSNQTIMVEKITWGDSIKIYHGMDEVTALSFLQIQSGYSANDKAIYKSLLACKGEIVPFPHRFVWMISKLNNMPNTKDFIRNALQEGHIKREAFYIINRFIRKGDFNGN